MLMLRLIAGRIVVTLYGKRHHVGGEMTLAQARFLRGELDDLIASMELGGDAPGTLDGLIRQIGVRDPA